MEGCVVGSKRGLRPYAVKQRTSVAGGEDGLSDLVHIRAAACTTVEYAARGYFTVYDGIVGPWFLPTFAAASGGVELHYVVLMPPLRTCPTRAVTRAV